MRMRTIVAAAVLAAAPSLGVAQGIDARAGWAVHGAEKSYDQLVADVKAAVEANQMAVVTEAGPTGAAAKRGITIPGNRVIGIFNNDFAVKILDVSTAAMIEAPVRMYVTDDGEGTATLSYKLPSHVFAPYADEGGETLQALVAELDARFAAIAEAAVQ